MGKSKLHKAATKQKSNVVRFKSDAAREEFLRRLKQHRNDVMSRPKLFLMSLNSLSYVMDKNSMEIASGLSRSGVEKFSVPLYPNDIQHLISYVISGVKAPFKPRWCKVLRYQKVSAITLVIIPNVTYMTVKEYMDTVPAAHMNQQEYVKTELIPPSFYGCSLISEVLNVRISTNYLHVKGEVSLCEVAGVSRDVKRKRLNAHVRKGQWEGERQELGPIHSPWLTVSGCTRYPAHLYPDHAAIHHPQHSHLDNFPRTQLLLSTEQMVHEGYPLPTIENYSEFVYTKSEYEPVTSSSPMYGIDCEMVRTVDGARALARVSVVNEDHDVVYDSLVKPDKQIADYMTPYSGVTKAVLDPVNVTLSDVQREIRRVLPPHAILCGQSQNFDLIAMGMFHPYNIDTSVIYKLNGYNAKTSLKQLTKLFLGEHIQNSDFGHDSVEDAKAALQLVQLKLSKGAEFGDVERECVSRRPAEHTAQDAAHRYNYYNRTGYYQSTLALLNDDGKASLVLDSEDSYDTNYSSHKLHVTKFINCPSNKRCVKAYRQHAGSLYFTVVNLCEHSQNPADTEYMRKLDKDIKKIDAASSDKSLQIILFEGSHSARTKRDAGMCLVKINRRIEPALK